MKKIFYLLLTSLLLLSFGCGSAQEAAKGQAAEGKILVAYFSCTGNTKALAEKVASVSGGDLFEIAPEVPYTMEDLNWHDETTRATVEQKDLSSRPALKAQLENAADYRGVVLLYPIWWGQAPRLVDTFLESTDLAGKVILPISMAHSSDIGSSADNLAELAPDADWQTGKGYQGQPSEAELRELLTKAGIMH